MARTKAKPSGRRARRQTATKRRSVAKATNTAGRQTKPRQRFVVSHHREEDFEGGLRRYAKYRTSASPSHQRDGAGPRDPLRSALPPGRGLEAPLSRRRFPDGLRAQRLDQPCQLIFLCLYSQYVTSAWAQMVGPLSQHGRNKIFKIRPR